MKIRTSTQLSDTLSRELSWRKTELSELRSLIDKSQSSNSKYTKLLLRSAIALLYAHFEGYIKKAGNHYLEYVRMQRLKYDELSDIFFTIALKQRFLFHYGSKKYSPFNEVTHFLRNSTGESAKFDHKSIIDTESNLSSPVFKEIVFTLGLDYSIFEGSEKLIDVKLLAKRNHIAHGEEIDIDMDDYQLVHDRVIQILENFRDQIENSVALKKYKIP